ncbi:conserved hypothetical protein [Pectobacterium parmentieri WPP163]|uniref:DUF4123 domain-containing protein n=1 Tax=Pectobacterium parmentieri TaxID=1905730 RepID=UPI0001B0D931|nr:DUF4123 domain-containing protein [Pectobacterium parmentieri]ACX89190.1 conserved hypothetical protein [Pectobacterium parmentieri WPP163]AYH06879.1 DUF4123 domain-containing protein [Pectobacterium parmentieri]AYH15690.1 DUF4123 domain-containing protein [Pectobacterium parmentieri]AYH24399.1 DUF4123 domain-containing protein [Pectobacterium parmentieri]MBN3179285.1 DUF4123 domain-containing protein [Pectobacterium parmentieri]
MSEITRWAIVDAAAEPELFSMLEQFDPPHASLYADPVPENIGRLAPHLVRVDDAIIQWLEQRKTPWGILLESRADMKTLRQHLRKYLHVQIPNEEKPVFFRFYDPRNIWPLLSVLSDWEKHSFLGPIEVITTNWQGTSQCESFATLRATFHAGSASRRKIMRISPEQMDELTLIFEQRYIEGLVSKIERWDGESRSIDLPKIGEIFRWLKLQGITDDRSIRGLFSLFHSRDYLTLEDIPADFKNILCAEGKKGVFKAEVLLLRELGCVPL